MKYLATVIVLVCFHSCYGIDLKPYNVTALGMFIGYDYNQDGYFTLDELHRSFTVYDVDHDGRVTRHEYTSYVDTHTPTLHVLSHALYDDYDMDHDHHLDEHDFENLFNIIDTDRISLEIADEKVCCSVLATGDRRVTVQEWENYWVHQFTKYEHLHGHGIGR